MLGWEFAFLSLFGYITTILSIHMLVTNEITAFLEDFTPVILSVVIAGVILHIVDTAKQHVHRLETINIVSREIMKSLDTKQTLILLDATIHEMLEADTFFIGILEGEEISLELFYDGGEYFNGTRIPVKGTLSGWVIKNQKELFLPDIREEVQLDGVERFVIGNEKTSLSWIGIPLKSENITGVLAMASYTPNAFDRADLELLTNLGQHVTLALDNTIRHTQVEKQARLDSLTGVYNHGYFLESLTEQAESSSRQNKPLSLIMLDIDYFKRYNDTYGHLIGDRVLKALCAAIQQNIKHTDAVGRWGGEEFIISLPGANGLQAFQVAKRIGETLEMIRVRDCDEKTIAIPTISQGIAVFPGDADEIFRLIDTADKRLYTAKKRGRNQIEPSTNF
jgi:diguanylate cyclase (GGDEF)-like protein